MYKNIEFNDNINLINIILSHWNIQRNYIYLKRDNVLLSMR